ncbi:MAG: rhodanese-like domain-containing protein [Xanthomonadales bacterium]|nr:rhodanese-like domain-containing protein [Xanthomonadales bacterium]
MQRLIEFISNHPLLAAAFVGLLVAWIAWEISQRFRGFKEISSAQLVRMINDEAVALFDLGAVADYGQGHIAGAKHMAISQVDPQSRELAKLKDQPIALYCKSGMSTAPVASRLVKAGFSQVHTLKGGLQGWVADGLPLVKGKK